YYVRGKLRTSIESVETNCDQDFVEYFRQVPGSQLYTFRVVKEAPTFTISITIKATKSQRVLYHLKKLEGCQFLNNPFVSKAFGHTYRMIVANKTFFRCPIRPKVYFLQNLRTAKVLQYMHPPGHYQQSMKVHMSISPSPFVMEVLWKYKVANIK
ncbi:hypothetical protein KR215_005803, partial [Drosophila sulfurigaster]